MTFDLILFSCLINFYSAEAERYIFLALFNLYFLLNYLILFTKFYDFHIIFNAHHIFDFYYPDHWDTFLKPMSSTSNATCPS